MRNTKSKVLSHFEAKSTEEKNQETIQNLVAMGFDSYIDEEGKLRLSRRKDFVKRIMVEARQDFSRGSMRKATYTKIESFYSDYLKMKGK